MTPLCDKFQNVVTDKPRANTFIREYEMSGILMNLAFNNISKSASYKTFSEDPSTGITQVYPGENFSYEVIFYDFNRF